MTTPADRIASLDLLRGIAVMGILLMNITSFAMPSAAYFNPAAWGGMSGPDVATWLVGFIFVDGKMRGLFSLLYGASMLLLIDRAEMAGRNGHSEQIVRSAWLFLFGFAHFVLLWWGDILMPYALIGCVALLFVRREPLDLLKWAFLAFLCHFILLALWTAAIWSVTRYGSAAEITATLDSIGRPGSPEALKEVALYRSGFVTILIHNLRELPAHAGMLFYFALDTLGFMLLGMAMLKGGFLTGRWPVEQYARTARHCLLIGIPPMIALGGWAIFSGFAPVTTFGIVFTWSFPFRIPMTVGYAALILIVGQRFADSALAARISAAGRMAFSNYLGTSLLMCAIFYGWGLGLFGHVGRVGIYGFVPLAWAIMLLWSKPWLDRFAYGPLEWLWRSLTRRKLQPLRRAPM